MERIILKIDQDYFPKSIHSLACRIEENFVSLRETAVL